MSSSVDRVDMHSSSESIPLPVLVGGVGGVAAEAMIFFVGEPSLLAEVIVASAAFRFLVVGGMVTVRGAVAPPRR